MIPRPNITEWSRVAPWLTSEQVEQDLLLSRLIVEIANDPYLGPELEFRGGTCLHKLRISPPLRYSEDLDYVRRSEGGIGQLVTALRRIGENLGMKVTYEITKYPRVRFSAPFESGQGTVKIKIEVNTFERSQRCPPNSFPSLSSAPGSEERPTCKRSLLRSSSPRKSARSTNDRRAAICSIFGSDLPDSPCHQTN